MYRSCLCRLACLLLCICSLGIYCIFHYWHGRFSYGWCRGSGIHERWLATLLYYCLLYWFDICFLCYFLHDCFSLKYILFTFVIYYGTCSLEFHLPCHYIFCRFVKIYSCHRWLWPCRCLYRCRFFAFSCPQTLGACRCDFRCKLACGRRLGIVHLRILFLCYGVFSDGVKLLFWLRGQNGSSPIVCNF